MKEHFSKRGFTLIELSIVLVIIGLIVGGVLVGRDLIRAAAVRSQISQIDTIQQGVNTFRLKYNYLPGDIAMFDADRFGFAGRGNLTGQGDGNGIIESSDYSSTLTGYGITGGENALFWVDLSLAKLITGQFNTADCCNVLDVYSPAEARALFPEAKLGAASNNGVPVLYVWSKNGKNYLGLATISTTNQSYIDAYNTPLTPYQAQAIDTKTDDGLPLGGNIITAFISDSSDSSTYVISTSSNQGLSIPITTLTSGATTATSSTCFDNGSVASAIQKYSVSSNPNRPACALSFKLQ